MATSKKLSRRAYAPRPDKYSKKKDGYVQQTLRITVDEAELIREAALRKNQSTNNWMSNHLLAAAKKELAAAEKENS